MALATSWHRLPFQVEPKHDFFSSLPSMTTSCATPALPLSTAVSSDLKLTLKLASSSWRKGEERWYDLHTVSASTGLDSWTARSTSASIVLALSTMDSKS